MFVSIKCRHLFTVMPKTKTPIRDIETTDRREKKESQSIIIYLDTIIYNDQFYSFTSLWLLLDARRGQFLCVVSEPVDRSNVDNRTAEEVARCLLIETKSYLIINGRLMMTSISNGLSDKYAAVLLIQRASGKRFVIPLVEIKIKRIARDNKLVGFVLHENDRNNCALP